MPALTRLQKSKKTIEWVYTGKTGSENLVQQVKEGDELVDDLSILLPGGSVKPNSFFFFDKLENGSVYGYFDHNGKRIPHVRSRQHIRKRPPRNLSILLPHRTPLPSTRKFHSTCQRAWSRLPPLVWSRLPIPPPDLPPPPPSLPPTPNHRTPLPSTPLPQAPPPLSRQSLPPPPNDRSPLPSRLPAPPTHLPRPLAPPSTDPLPTHPNQRVLLTSRTPLSIPMKTCTLFRRVITTSEHRTQGRRNRKLNFL